MFRSKQSTISFYIYRVLRSSNILELTIEVSICQMNHSISQLMKRRWGAWLWWRRSNLTKTMTRNKIYLSRQGCVVCLSRQVYVGHNGAARRPCQEGCIVAISTDNRSGFVLIRTTTGLIWEVWEGYEPESGVLYGVWNKGNLII